VRVGLPISTECYCVLGDDLVIFNKKVAEEYVALCESFGIIIGLAKSFVSEVSETDLDIERLGVYIDEGLDMSKGEAVTAVVKPLKPAVFNFANQTFVDGLCASVISIKEEMSCDTPYKRIALAQRLVQRG
jgi:hypothetical protein